MMKSLVPWALALVLPLLVFFFQEARIDSLEAEIKGTADSTDSMAQKSLRPRPGPSSDLDSGESEKSTRPATADDTDKTIDKTAIRNMSKVMSNDAGKAMMRSGLRTMIKQTYDDFMDSLDLSPEERQHFEDLLVESGLAQQELSMKLMGAKDGEQEEILEELGQGHEARNSDIKEFLNDDDDFAAFERFEQEAPSRQQLSGLREAFATSPLTQETEEALIDVLTEARINVGEADSTDPAESMRKFFDRDRDVIGSSRDAWERQDAYLARELPDVLEPDQIKTFNDYWKQVRELQSMQLEMMQKHLAPEPDADDGPGAGDSP